jgi:hypothetical protein
LNHEKDVENIGYNFFKIEPVLKKLKVADLDHSDSEDEEFDAGQLKISRVGSLLRQSQDKVSHLKVSFKNISCHKNVKLFNANIP